MVNLRKAIHECALHLPSGASGGTVAVWVAPDKREREEIHLVQTVKALEERVMSLETIYTSLPDIAKSLPLSDAKELN